MKIIFTGHRDKLVDLSMLEEILQEYPEAIWVHGGAVGFDAQVDAFAKSKGIETLIFKPNYQKYHPKRAPLARNDEMLAIADLVAALHDGRKSGGTAYTIKKAIKAGLKIIYFPCP